MPAGNDANCSPKIYATDYDPWGHWRNGPLLRKDSITARQLTYLTPQSVSLENRKIFIGEFSDGWVEANAKRWHDDVQTIVEELEASEASEESIMSRQDADAKTLHKADMELATAIAQGTENAIEIHPKDQERRVRSLRLRPSRFRNHKLNNVEADSASTTSKGLQSRASSSQLELVASQAFPTNSELDLDKTPKPDSLTSSMTVFYDCEETLHDRLSFMKGPDVQDSDFERPEQASTPATSFESCSQQDEKTPDIEVERASSVPTEQVDNADEVPRPLSHGELSSTKRRRSHRLQSLARIRRPKSPKIKLYQGKFLVQERRVRDGRTVESEVHAPLATQLITRWKEYAVLAQKTGDLMRPLVLYFYDCQDHAKLSRKSQRRWTRSLAFKVAVDHSYRVTIFSPLDFSIALWRPKLPKSKRSSHKYFQTEASNKKDDSEDHHPFGPFSFLLIHAQSLMDILHLAYLLTSATSGTPWTHGTELVNVTMPSPDINLQVSYRQGSEGIEEELRQLHIQNRELISYEDLLAPIVSQSNIIQTISQSIWNAVKNLPRRIAISPEDESNKFALACTFNGFDHRPLWLTRLASTSCSIPWIFWFLRSYASISLVQPRPKCNENTCMNEPPALEGYCSNMFTTKIVSGSSYSKPAFSTKRNYSLYLFTADSYLLCTTNQYAEPPILAANQDNVEKVAEPYPLDSDGQHIEWIRKSTCLHEIDYHDAVACAELRRRKRLNANARVLIDLVYLTSFQSNEKGDVEMRGICDHATIVSFGSKEVANCWAKRLQEVSLYWRNSQKARNTKRAAGLMSDLSISSMLQNRSIVYSGTLFMKQHRFTSFKAYQVLLTTDFLLVFKIDQTKRPPAQPAENLPAGSFMHRHYKNIDLHDTYVYTGQVAIHALLNDDNFTDPSNPGVRSLPRAYEDGRISQDSELDRCFVLWHVRKSRLPIVNSAGDGQYIAFLAQEKVERDKWTTAIRYVQTEYVKKRRRKEGSDLYKAASIEEEMNSDISTTPPNHS